MSNYKVAQPACYVTVPGAGAVLLYRDAPVPDSAENLDQLEEDGFIVKVPKDEEAGGHPSDLPEGFEAPVFPDSPAADAKQSDADADSDGPPAKSASKAEWVDYAVAQGADRAEAEAATKDDLVATYGG